jgi:polyisoprenoid-binding protein YceI
MKHLSLAALTLGAVLANATARASTWQIDPAHTTVTFAVRHMMVTSVKGLFGRVTGTVDLEDKDVTRSSIDVQIDPKSVDTREPKRDAHLRSADFFDVARHPMVAFKSTRIERVGRDKLKVTGQLTLHGISKPVTLAVETTPEIDDALLGRTRGAHATGKLSRKEWGLTWNKTLDAGGVLVSDEVLLDIDVEMHLAEPSASPAMSGPLVPATNVRAAGTARGGHGARK